jgi:signal transduction histidine kinase
MALGNSLRKSLAMLLAVWLFATCASAATLVIDPKQETITLGPHLLVIPDPDASLKSDDVRAGRYDSRALAATPHVPNLGYVSYPYWIRIALANPADIALERVLVLRRGTKHVQDIWVESAGTVRQLRIGRGGTVSGDVQSRHAVVRLSLPPHATMQITIRLESRTGVTLDYVLTTERALARADALDLWLYGVLFGIGLAIGIYSLFIFAATREIGYLWFAGFALLGVVYQMHFESFAFIGVWGHEQLLGNYASLYVGVAYAICTLGFLRSIIEAERIMPRADRWLFKPQFFFLLLAFPLFPFYWWIANRLAALGITLSTMTLGVAAIVAVMRGSVRVRSIPIAVVVLSLAGTMFMLKQAGLVPDLPIFAVLFPVTLGLAMLTFALAIAERVRLIARDHRLAVKRNEDRLEQMVSERTAELSVAKENAEQALQLLQTAQGELVAAEKMASLGQLVAGVAHEINTPIGVAITAASFLADRSGKLKRQLEADTLKPSELAAYVDEASRSATMVGTNLDRAAHLIRTFKQVSVDRSTDDRRRFNLGQYIRDLIESLEFTWKRRPIKLEVDCDEDIELDSYPGALGQVITNLIQNALQHAFEGGRAGTMRLMARRVGNGLIDLSFADDGTGIAPDALVQVFEPFYTTKRGQGGTGLGLHIVFNLVTAKLGGRIEASGAPGRGMRFTMRIPDKAPAKRD